MKRFLAIVLTAMLLVAALPVSAFADTTKTVYVSRNGSGQINLRKGAGYSYEVTGNYAYHNSKVSVLSSSGKWSKVKVKSSGKVGWIRTYYIDGTTKALGTGTHQIKSAASVYAKADSSSSKKGSVAAGDTVKVFYTERDFASVTITGSSVEGWIPMSCIGGAVNLTPEKPSGGAKTAYRVKTNGGNLNVRAGAGTGYKIINSLPNGTGCTVLQKSGNWYKIKTFKGVTGWVSKNYLAKNCTAHVKTNGGNLNVRKGPGTSKAVLGSLANGAKVTVKSVSGNWAYLTGGGLTGWCSMNYLKF